MGVYPGPIDTNMAKDFPVEKSSPEETAIGTLQAIEEGQEDIFIDVFALQFQKDFWYCQAVCRNATNCGFLKHPV